MHIHVVFHVLELFQQRGVSLAIRPFVCAGVFVRLSVLLSVCLYVSPSVFLSVCLPVCLSARQPSVCLSVRLYMSVRLHKQMKTLKLQGGCDENEDTFCCILARAWPDVVTV